MRVWIFQESFPFIRILLLCHFGGQTVPDTGVDLAHRRLLHHAVTLLNEWPRTVVRSSSRRGPYLGSGLLLGLRGYGGWTYDEPFVLDWDAELPSVFFHLAATLEHEVLELLGVFPSRG